MIRPHAAYRKGSNPLINDENLPKVGSSSLYVLYQAFALYQGTSLEVAEKLNSSGVFRRGTALAVAVKPLPMAIPAQNAGAREILSSFFFLRVLP